MVINDNQRIDWRLQHGDRYTSIEVLYIVPVFLKSRLNIKHLLLTKFIKIMCLSTNSVNNSIRWYDVTLYQVSIVYMGGNQLRTTRILYIHNFCKLKRRKHLKVTRTTHIGPSRRNSWKFEWVKLGFFVRWIIMCGSCYLNILWYDEVNLLIHGHLNRPEMKYRTTSFTDGNEIKKYCNLPTLKKILFEFLLQILMVLGGTQLKNHEKMIENRDSFA